MPVVLWLVAGPEAPVGRRGAEAGSFLAVGQVAGLVGMALLSVSFVLSARLRGLEDYFGGLDGMYRSITASASRPLGSCCYTPSRSRCDSCRRSGGGPSRFCGPGTSSGRWTSASTPSGG